MEEEEARIAEAERQVSVTSPLLRTAVACDVMCVLLQAEEQALAAIVQERDEALMMKRKMEEDARRIAEEEERLR